MASCCKELAKIDKKTKYGVYGWIRKAEMELQLFNIPLMIANICVLYFYEEDVFHQIADSMVVSDDRKFIAKIKDSSWSNMNYGIIEIESNNRNVYRWEFEISDCTSFVIGITDMSNSNGDLVQLNQLNQLQQENYRLHQQLDECSKLLQEQMLAMGQGLPVPGVPDPPC